MYILETNSFKYYLGERLLFKLPALKLHTKSRIGLIGLNGSGKTTLMNMLSGIYFPDQGQIMINGQNVVIASPKDALNLGIGMVHQHFKLVDVLTAAENIVLGLPGKGKLDMKKITEDIQKLADKYGFELDLSQKIYEMSVSQKQTVEIIKMLYRGARILILDEPTAVLTPQESDRNMRKDGCSIMIITHKLQEVLALSDRVAILRKGKYIDTVETAQANAQSLSEMMVGGRVDLNIDRPEPENVKKRLVVKGLNCKNKEEVKTLDDVDLTVNAGEILGIAGISGSGQKEFLEAMDYEQASPSLSQAQRLKKLSQEGGCTLDAMCEVMNEIKKDELDHVTIKNEVLRKYFPKSYTPKQMQDTIIRLLEKWQRSKQRDMER